MMGGLRSWWRQRGSAGRRGERVAARHLKGRGYRILGRNVRCRQGEIDLVAREVATGRVVIVEVKTRAAGYAHRPELQVDGAKQRKLVALAAELMRAGRIPRGVGVRFDVIGVDLPARGRPVVRHHRGAFESTLR